MTMHEEDEAILAAIRAGARGYVLKGSAQEETLRANAAIAATLSLSQKTVRNYVSGIFAKLEVVDRAEAGLVARAPGLGAAAE